MHICVIGAGVIGVATARMLERQGYTVTLVDEHDKPARMSSFANGGQLSYSYVAPLAGPGVLPNIPLWLWRKDSPLRFQPRLDPDQWRWLTEFVIACRGSVASATTKQMLTLSYLSRSVMHDLLADTPVDFSWQKTGKLIVYRDAKLLEKAARLVEYQARFGSDQRVLSASEVLALEPAIRGLDHTMAGAVYTPSEETGDCAQFTQGLFDQLQQSSSVTCRMSTKVSRLRREQGRVVALESDQGDIVADAFVVTSGMGSRTLLRPLGATPSIYPLKGYSLSVPVADFPGKALQVSVTDYERRIVYARIGDVLRVAAMVDIGGRDNNLDPQRITQLKQQVKEVFPDLALDNALAWAGLRPSTATGKPIIGRSQAASNLWLNTGHGALGFTLAMGSAALLTAQLAGQQPPIDPSPFVP
jgi:D-amino-acid dehydrogenase